LPRPSSLEAFQAEAERMMEAEWDELAARREEQREGLGDLASWDPQILAATQ
jgi:hypothetical protein